MVPAELPGPVHRFIVDHLDSVEELEILLLLHQKPDRWWTIADVNAAIRTSMASARDRLRHLAARKLVAAEHVPEPRYRFDDSSDRLRLLVSQVA